MKYMVYVKKKGEWTEMEKFKKMDEAQRYAIGLRNIYQEIRIDEVD